LIPHDMLVIRPSLNWLQSAITTTSMTWSHFLQSQELLDRSRATHLTDVSQRHAGTSAFHVPNIKIT
jgi:hypothetical protein